MWLLRQAVKTPPSHGGFMSSNLIGVTKIIQARIYILAFLLYEIIIIQLHFPETHDRQHQPILP